MSDNQNPYNTPNKIPTNPNDKKWGMALHLSALIGLLLPLGLVLGPLIVWMLKKNDGEYFDVQGKNAVNFQLTILIAAFVFAVLGTMIKPLFTLAFVAGIAGILFAVIAGINVSSNGDYKYPFSFRFIK
jgi:uncharacterized Tic20 family protein